MQVATSGRDGHAIARNPTVVTAESPRHLSLRQRAAVTVPGIATRAPDSRAAFPTAGSPGSRASASRDSPRGSLGSRASPRRVRAGSAASGREHNDLDELATAVDVAAHTHAVLEARVRELDATGQSFQWTTVEAREKLLQHFERMRQELVDALDRRQLALLRQLDFAAAQRQATIVESRAAVQAAALELGEECRACRDGLGGGGVAAQADTQVMVARLTAAVQRAELAPTVPDVGGTSFGVDVDDELIDSLARRIEDHGRIRGYTPHMRRVVLHKAEPQCTYCVW